MHELHMYEFMRKPINCAHDVGVWSCKICIDLAFEEDHERNELRDKLTKERQRIAHQVIDTTLVATCEHVVPTDASSIIRFTPARESSSNRWTVYIMNIGANRYVSSLTKRVYSYVSPPVNTMTMWKSVISRVCVSSVSPQPICPNNFKSRRSLGGIFHVPCN